QNQWSMLELMNRSIDTMQNTIAHMKLAAHQPDVLIEIPRGVGGLFDYHLASDMIEDGYQLCAAALDRYEAKLGRGNAQDEDIKVGADEL
ncbi:MAG: hypothetical protein WD668_05855, partial [Saccharospirillum sp.]